MPRLVVVSGPAGSGKIAKAWAAAAPDPSLRFLHRDQVRVLFGRLIDEAHLTELIGVLAERLLSQGYGVVTAAQNQSPSDAALWSSIAQRTGAALEWISTAPLPVDRTPTEEVPT